MDPEVALPCTPSVRSTCSRGPPQWCGCCVACGCRFSCRGLYMSSVQKPCWLMISSGNILPNILRERYMIYEREIYIYICGRDLLV